MVERSAPLARDAMAYVLAGGRGSRLKELTDRRAKPAVYFGGKTRIIDFALSNALNSGIRRIGVATQYKAHSLIRHLQRGWDFFRPERNESFDILPASQRVSETQWYEGTADAVYQNLDIIADYDPEFMVILAGDHIYKMDYELMLQQHVDSGADVTVGCLEVPRMEAIGFGVMHVDDKDQITAFVEKPADPPGIPGQPDMALASMGIYVFHTKFLADLLRRDAETPGSSRDFGKDLIPYVVEHGKAVAHRFGASCVRSSREGVAYWRDVGTVDAYWEANIDLTDIIPELDLYDTAWPIWTYAEIKPPAKFVHDVDGRRGEAISSLVSGDCIISGAGLRRSLLFTGVRVHSYSTLEEAVILPDVDIGRKVRLRKVVVDRGVEDPRGPRRRRRPRARRAALPAQRGRRLPDHPADDRRARRLMRVLSVASEVYPLIKTGGLADVAGALPPALGRRGIEVRTLLPGYPTVMEKLGEPRVVHDYPSLLGVPARLLAAEVAGLSLIVLDSPALYDRPGGPYGDRGGRDHPDNWRRFGALGRAAVDVAMGHVPGFVPDVVHAHDWQAGLAPAYLRYWGIPRPSVMTIHNIAFQGGFPASVFGELELPPQAFALDGVEFHGGVGYLKAGLASASAITTVSPTYAEEIQTPEYGIGLQGLIAARAGVLHGIVNGIDTEVWNPETDPLLAAPFSAPQAAGPRRQPHRRREALRPARRRLGALRAGQPADLAEGHRPPRLDHPPGHRRGRAHRLAVLGSGDRGLEATFLTLAAQHPGRVGVVIGYDEPLVAHHAGWRRRHPDPVALRALRPDPALRPALRLRADRRADRRPRRHGDRRQHRRAERRRRHRLPVHPGRRRAARRGDPPRHDADARPGRLDRDPEGRG